MSFASQRMLCGLSAFILFFSVADCSFSQWNYNRVRITDDGIFMGGAGLAFIDGERFAVLNFRTEVTSGNWGLGVDLPLRFNTQNGELRSQDWDSAYDYFRVIRYLRYGRKRRTPVYGRLGTLDAARLGHGFIMSHYTNEARYDDRKLGMLFDLKFRRWGFESVVSNFEDLEIVGGRGYIRPFREISQLWFFKRMAFGTTFVTDRANSVSSVRNHITITGFDIEVPLLRFGPLHSLIYADHAQILHHGSGQAVGLEVIIWRLGGLVTFQSKLERRFLGREFLASYFDPFYEVERVQNSGSGIVRKSDLLAQRLTKEKGIYGELLAQILNAVRVQGTFERVDRRADSGRLHIAALLMKPVARFTARAIYDRRQVRDFEDVFQLDERSILRAGLGYQMNPYLYLFTDYVWSFEINATTGQLETQRRVEPQLTFVMPF